VVPAGQESTIRSALLDPLSNHHLHLDLALQVFHGLVELPILEFRLRILGRQVVSRNDLLVALMILKLVAIAVLLVRLLGALAASLALVYSPTTTGLGETVDLPLLVASAVCGVLTLIGLGYLILRSPIHALRWFKRALVASIR